MLSNLSTQVSYVHKLYLGTSIEYVWYRILINIDSSFPGKDPKSRSVLGGIKKLTAIAKNGMSASFIDGCFMNTSQIHFLYKYHDSKMESAWTQVEEGGYG